MNVAAALHIIEAGGKTRIRQDPHQQDEREHHEDLKQRRAALLRSSPGRVIPG